MLFSVISFSSSMAEENGSFTIRKFVEIKANIFKDRPIGASKKSISSGLGKGLHCIHHRLTLNEAGLHSLATLAD